MDKNTGRIFDPDGNELELRHQSREVLAALAEKPGETVTRQSLINNVWSGRTVSDDSVAQCIAEIRRVVNDTDKRIVETVPREGYRLNPNEAAVPSGNRRFQSSLLRAVALMVVLAAGAITYALLYPGAPTEERPVIAVLPFEDFSTAPHQGYLSDAVSENIITALARYPQLMVISRHSSFQFRNTGLGISDIAKQLGAGFVLEGSQQYNGSRLRITAQLIDAKTEAHIWADEVDVPMGSLLEANSQISKKIANAVGFSVIDTAQARMTAGDVSAMMICNAAQSRIMRNFTRENLLKNIEEQERAIRDYPESACGYLGQSLALRIGLRHGWIEGDEAMIRKRMYDLARRSVELDPNSFMAHFALGRALMHNRDVDAAIGAFRRSVELNSSSYLAHNGLALALIYVGKTDQALDVIANIERIDPLYGFSVTWTKVLALWQAEKCDEALATFQSTPSMPVAAYKELAAIHHCLGNEHKATKAMNDYLAENPNWTLLRIEATLSGMYTAQGALDRWLVAMEAAGMPKK